MAEGTTISSLPQEVLLRVFSYLGPKDLGVVVSVCSAWKALANDDAPWKALCAWHERRDKVSSITWKQYFRRIILPTRNVRAGRYVRRVIPDVDLAILPCRVGNRYALIRSDHRSIALWDPEAGSIVGTISPGKQVLQMTPFCNGKGQERLALGDVEGTITIWDPQRLDSAVHTFRPFGNQNHPCIALTCWPHKGGDWLAIGGLRQPMIKVWQSQGRKILQFQAESGVVSLQAIGTYLAVLTEPPKKKLEFWSSSVWGFERLWSKDAVSSSATTAYPQRHLLGCMGGLFVVCQDPEGRVCTWNNGMATPLSSEKYRFSWIRVDENKVIGGSIGSVEIVGESARKQLEGSAFIPSLLGAKVVKKNGWVSCSVRWCAPTPVAKCSVATNDYQVAPLPQLPIVVVDAGIGNGLLALDFRKGTTHKPLDYTEHRSLWQEARGGVFVSGLPQHTTHGLWRRQYHQRHPLCKTLDRLGPCIAVVGFLLIPLAAYTAHRLGWIQAHHLNLRTQGFSTQNL